ncbi:MAG: hypothetical protein WD534_07860 [Phycisphaeraceae bacterium]
MEQRNGAGVPVGRVTATLAVICGVLALLGGVSQAVFIWRPGLPGADTLVDLFWVNHEQTVWTWASSVLELGCAVLLAVIWASQRRRDPWFARYWLGLAVLFLAMSVDDVAMFHERSERALTWLETTGVFYFKWTLLALPFVLVVGLIYLRFLLKLPGWVRWRIVLAGGLFVGGAVGLEMVNSHIGYHQGESPLYQANTLVEECVEQAGLIVFIHVLLRYLAAAGVTWQVRFADEAVQTDAHPEQPAAVDRLPTGARPAAPAGAKLPYTTRL